MKLILDKKRIKLMDNDECIKEYKLTSNVIYSRAAYFEDFQKWKVKDDANTYKPIIEALLKKSEVTSKDLEPLDALESFYETMTYADDNKVKEASDLESFNASRKSLVIVPDFYDNPSDVPQKIKVPKVQSKEQAVQSVKVYSIEEIQEFSKQYFKKEKK